MTPKERKAVFRKRPSRQEIDRILCLKETRTVKQDHTVSFEGLTLQIPASSKWISIAKQKVEVLQLQDGRIEIWYKQQKVLSLLQQAVEEMVKKNKTTKTQLLEAA